MNKCVGIVLLFLLMTAAASSCSVGKKPVRKKLIVDSAGTAAPAADTAMRAETDTTAPAGTPSPSYLNEEKRTLISNILPLAGRSMDFATFSGKAKCHFEGRDDRQDFIASIRIKKDSAIWISVNALGGMVQVARMLITPDSVRMVNYLDKEATLLPAYQATGFLPVNVDFSVLQNLLIGNILSSGGDATDATDFGGTLSLQLEDAQFIQQVTYNKSDSTMRSNQVRARDHAGPAIMIQYGNYKEATGRTFPESRAINIINGGEQYYLDMNFNSAEFDLPVDLPFSVPRKFTLKEPAKN